MQFLTKILFDVNKMIEHCNNSDIVSVSQVSASSANITRVTCRIVTASSTNNKNNNRYYYHANYFCFSLFPLYFVPASFLFLNVISLQIDDHQIIWGKGKCFCSEILQMIGAATLTNQKYILLFSVFCWTQPE